MDVVNRIPKSPQELVNFVTTVPMFPVFLVVHYLLVTLQLRKRSGSREYAESHPFASLFVCVVSCLGGSLISNFLLGRSLLYEVFYLNNFNMILMAAVWYLVMFCPFDFFEKFVNVKAVKAVILVLKEVHRIRNIQNGVETVSKVYVGASLEQIFFVAVLIGSVRGSGAKFILRPLDSFIRGNMVSDNEFLKPTFSTKHSVVSSALILLQRMGHIPIDEPLLITVLFVFAGTVQLVIFFFEKDDPYTLLENLFAAVFFKLPKELSKQDTKKKAD